MNNNELTFCKQISRPSDYARVRLGMRLHPVQSAVLDGLFRPRSRVILRAANGCGKTGIVITAAILYALEILQAQCVSTAAAFRQIKSQLMPSLKSYRHLYPGWDFQNSTINIGGLERYVGFATNNAARFQGYHNKPEQPLLIVVDEAAGVADTIFDQAEERCQPAFLLLTGSPLGPTGRFYKVETDQASFYKHFVLRAHDCLEKDGYWLIEAELDRIIAKWGINHPLVRSSIFAEFGGEIAGAIITLARLQGCIDNPPEFVDGPVKAFADFAAGRAENVLAVKKGNKVWIEKAWVDKDTMAAAGQFYRIFRRLERELGLKPDDTEGDADGMGKPVCDRIRELGWPIRSFHGGADPRFDEEYKNVIGEVWGEGAKKISNREIILAGIKNDQGELVIDDEFRAQILNRTNRMNSSGKMELETKEELNTRNVPSPDRVDALLGALHPLNTGVMTWAAGAGIGQTNKPQWNRRQSSVGL